MTAINETGPWDPAWTDAVMACGAAVYAGGVQSFNMGIRILDEELARANG